MHFKLGARDGNNGERRRRRARAEKQTSASVTTFFIIAQRTASDKYAISYCVNNSSRDTPSAKHQAEDTSRALSSPASFERNINRPKVYIRSISPTRHINGYSRACAPADVCKRDSTPRRGNPNPNMQLCSIVHKSQTPGNGRKQDPPPAPTLPTHCRPHFIHERPARNAEQPRQLVSNRVGVHAARAERSVQESLRSARSKNRTFPNTGANIRRIEMVVGLCWRNYCSRHVCVCFRI